MNETISTPIRKKLVILGCGFAGLQLSKHLDKTEEYEIYLIDKHNYNEFSPLFYQVASCGLDSGSICFPIRREFKYSTHFHFCFEEMKSIDTEKQLVQVGNFQIPYDKLVIATGVVSRYFGNDAIRDYSFDLKSVPDALLLRDQILLSIEKANECTDIEVRKKLLTFVICGGGPAGAEIAGALGEFKKFIIPKQYKRLDSRDMRIIVIEGSGKIIHSMSEHASTKSAQFLQELGVELILGAHIQNYDGKTVTTDKGDSIDTQTLIWTAGVEGVVFPGLDKTDYGPGNRLLVDEYNRLKNHPEIFAIGDCCLMITDEKPRGDPQLAQVAMQQAVNLARNLKQPDVSKWKKFSYYDKGSMAIIGRNRAVVDLKHHHFAGRTAWWLWLFIHLIMLIGVRNKVVTFINWVWNYFSYDGNLQLIIKPSDRDKKPMPGE